ISALAPLSALPIGRPPASASSRILPAGSEKCLSPLPHLLAVMETHALIAYTAGKLAQPAFRLCPAYRRVEYPARGFAHPQQVGQGARILQDCAEGIRPICPEKIVRILACRQQGKARRPAGLDGGKDQIRRAPRSLDPCL